MSIREDRGLSIVIPAYNEEHAIARTISDIRNAMAGAAIPYHIIVVDDGSVDGTAKALADIRGLVIVKHAINVGYGASLKDGILKSSYDLVCIIDADGTYPVDRIPELLGYMDKYDMAVGARTGHQVSESTHRKLGKWILRSVAGIVSGHRIPDVNSGMRMFRKSDMLRFFKILPRGFSFTTTCTLAYLCNGLSIKYMPIDYYPRIGKSKIRPVSDGLKFMAIIARVVTRFKPLRIFLPVSALLLLSGLMALALSMLLGPVRGLHSSGVYRHGSRGRAGGHNSPAHPGQRRPMSDIRMYANICASALKNRLGIPCRPSFCTYLVTWRCNARCVMCDIWRNRAEDGRR